MDLLKDRVLRSKKMEVDIKVIGKQDKKTDSAKYSSQMEVRTLEIGKIINRKVMEP